MFNPLGQDTNSPILTFDSQKTGQHIVLTCLNHGDEVIGLNSALEVLEIVKNTEQFVGKITIFTCLNFEGFCQNSRFFQGEFLNGNVVPNLNREFPGNDNSYSAKTAKHVFDQILELKPDLVLDLHSYAHNSVIHTIIDRPGGEMEQNLIQLCQNSSVPFYLEYEAESFATQALDKSLSNQLCLHKIPSLTIELGPSKGFSLRQSELAKIVLINFLVATGNLEQKLEQNTTQNLAKNKEKAESNIANSDKKAGEITNQNKIETETENSQNLAKIDLFEMQGTQIDQSKTYFRASVCNESNFGGMWRPIVEIGKLIEKGTIIAQVVNLHGQIVHRITMPESGFIIAFADEVVVYPMHQIATFIREI